MLPIIKAGLVASTLLCLLSAPLNATSLTASTGPDSGATIFFNFDTITDTSVGTFSGGVLNGGADPLNTLGNIWLAAAISVTGSPQPFTLNFANPVGYAGFTWGSIDPTNGNTVDVYGPSSTLLATFTGADFTAAGGSNSGLPPPDYANIFAGPGELIQSLVFSQHNSGCCFETDNFSYISANVSQVPEPGALPLFAAGLGALGLLGWRKRKNAKV